MKGDAAKLRSALKRLLWNSVAEDAQCTCVQGDQCPQCEATLALGYGRWTSAPAVARKLVEEGR